MRLPGGRGAIPTMTIKDKAVLYSVYMPFLKNGGIFMPTNRKYTLGEDIFFLLKLMDEPREIPVAGTVVWITPVGAQGSRSSGVGVQFTGQDDTAKRTIETHLAGSLESDRPTQTL